MVLSKPARADMRNAMIFPAGAALLLAACGDGGGAPTPTTTTEVEVDDTVHSVSSTGMPTTTKSMDFQVCIASIQTVAGQLGVAPINIVETNDVRMVRFNTSDGSVLITCSRADRKMVMVQSPHRG